MCAHTHSKINTKVVHILVYKGQKNFCLWCCIYCRLCNCPVTAVSATTVLHVMKITSMKSTHLMLHLFKIYLYPRGPQHVYLDYHSKFFLPPSPSIVAKIINKLLAKRGVFLGRERRWFIFPVIWIYCLISFSLLGKAQFSQRPATTWLSEDKNSKHRALYFPQNQYTVTEDKAKRSISEQRKRPLKSQPLPELCFKFSKPGSPAGVVGPALGHKAVEGGRAVWRHWEPLTVLNPPNHIIVLHSLEGLYPVHEDLPHTHTWGTHTKTPFLHSEQTMRPVQRETEPGFVLIMQFLP